MSSEHILSKLNDYITGKVSHDEFKSILKELDLDNQDISLPSFVSDNLHSSDYMMGWVKGLLWGIKEHKCIEA